MMIGGRADGCPLSGVNQNPLLHRGSSANDPKRASSQTSFLTPFVVIFHSLPGRKVLGFGH
jgi:hypothetical protein